MQAIWLIFLLFGAVLSESNDDELHNKKSAEDQLATQIFAILDHYKQPDPVGVPGATIPDPLPVPDTKNSVGVATLTLKQTKAYGMSKFRIKKVKTDLNALTVNASVQLDVLTMKGVYTMSSFFTRTEGPFTIVLKNVFVQGNGSLAVERDGQVRTQNILMDITFGDLSMDFQNLGFMGQVFQSVVNSAPSLVFDAMKPFMLKEAYTKIRNEIDTKIEKVSEGHSFPNSISPLDMAIAEARKKVRQLGFDPFKVKGYNHTAGIFTIEMTNTWVIGISSFYRVGDIIIMMENNTATIHVEIGTQKITGMSQWELIVSNHMISRVGHVKFVVQHIKALVEMSQPLDTRKHPQINDLQLELGNIQIRCDGAGTLDYLTEFAVNIIPNILRYQIMDAIENPLKARLQEVLNTVNVEKLIKEKLPEFQQMGLSNMKIEFKA